MQSEKVHFTGERETALITLYARALQSRAKNPIFQDKWAVDRGHGNRRVLPLGDR